MARPKPKKNFVWVTDASSFSFQEEDRVRLLRAIPLEQDDARVNQFIKFVEQEITMLKPQRKLDIDSPRPQEVKEALTRLKKKSQKLHGELISFQEELSGLDAESRKLLSKVWDLYDDGAQKFYVFGLLKDLNHRIMHLCREINATDRITFKKGRPSDTTLRRFSRKLACAYREILGKRPPKYREGAFANILSICLNAAGYKLPKEIFHLIDQAVDHCNTLNSPSK